MREEIKVMKKEKTGCQTLKKSNEEIDWLEKDKNPYPNWKGE